MLEIYTKNYCPFCVQAKQLLDSYGIEYQEVLITDDSSARQKLIDMNLRTVPQIFYNDKLFVEGGYTGLSKLSKTQINEKLGNIDVSEFRL